MTTSHAKTTIIQNSSKKRNAEDEACARELLVLGGRSKMPASSSKALVNALRQHRKPMVIKKEPPLTTSSASGAPISIILDNSEIMNSNEDIDDDTFTFITGDNSGLSLVEPTLNSAILANSGHSNSSDGLKGHQRVVMHVAPSASDLNGGHTLSFAQALDGNLTDAESSDDEDKEPKQEKPASTALPVSGSNEGPSSSSQSNVNATREEGLLDLSAPKLSDTSTEDDNNQPIDYTKKTLSSSSGNSSHNSSSSSLVSPSSTSSRKPSGFILSVESLLAKSPPRSHHQQTTSLESASKTPYHPVEEKVDEKVVKEDEAKKSEVIAEAVKVTTSESVTLKVSTETKSKEIISAQPKVEKPVIVKVPEQSKVDPPVLVSKDNKPETVKVTESAGAIESSALKSTKANPSENKKPIVSQAKVNIEAAAVAVMQETSSEKSTEFVSIPPKADSSPVLATSSKLQAPESSEVAKESEKIDKVAELKSKETESKSATVNLSATSVVKDTIPTQPPKLSPEPKVSVSIITENVSASIKPIPETELGKSSEIQSTQKVSSDLPNTFVIASSVPESSSCSLEVPVSISVTSEESIASSSKGSNLGSESVVPPKPGVISTGQTKFEEKKDPKVTEIPGE